MPLPPDIDALSDDGEGGAAPANLPPPVAADDQRVVGKRKQKRSFADTAALASQHRKRLRVVVSRKCHCKNPDCRKVFDDDQQLFNRLLRKRLNVVELPKQESDQEVLCKVGSTENHKKIMVILG